MLFFNLNNKIVFNMPKKSKKYENTETPEKKFLLRHNLSLMITENDSNRLFYTRLLNKNEKINNSHIYVKWSNFVFNKSRNESCPIDKCIKCPSRWIHMNYAFQKFGFKNKKEFFKHRYDLRHNILRHISNEKLKELFDTFIVGLLNEPKSTGTKRSVSSVNTYVSQIKKWEKDLNKIIGSSIELTLDAKKLIKKNSESINIIDKENLNKITNCVLDESIWRNRLIHLRVKSMFFLMIQTGIRQSEIIDLDLSDYYEGFIRIRGKQPRRIALSENTQKTLNEYISMRFDSDSALFVNQDFFRITKSSVENAWKKISNIIDVHFSSMDIRRTSAVLFAKNQTNADELKKLYGFRTKQIAMKYFNEGSERNALEKQMSFDPIDLK